MKDMQCVKTGCHLYSREYQESFLGDLYQIGDTMILRCLGPGSRSYKPIRDKLNCIVQRGFHFWQCGNWYICIFQQGNVEMYSYEGEELIPTDLN